MQNDLISKKTVLDFIKEELKQDRPDDFKIRNIERFINDLPCAYDVEELEETIGMLKYAFPNSFINERGEFIAERKSNTYFNLKDCKTPLDIECKVLEWCSRPASKGQPYSAEWRNREFRKFMLHGINTFLETDFSEEDMAEIYTYLGNAIHHDRTIKFIESYYDMEVLND